ncbi:secondary thiamine-phosphate synthase enzyme YjbQ [Thalassotalea nanhaiensis]|uniref:Secondary thiamine-phosphate synthase enzyme YjbQ n=1 Tax=Thalassotalea nanhaiensis TaxID=3065648 RepID=A0ABY9TNU5_9GAMM|nr:secondary thiamine-phosphate synthase enzyme YjbQ [Colwelliaceae bacterium SQ345]
MWHQQQIMLNAKSRGFHLIDEEINGQLPQIKKVETGLLHLFLQHTSASLTINENADPTVRGDLERHFNKFVPENAPYYQHDYEGPDDMPAHIKSSILGCQITVPICNGQLAMGTWQGIFLCEHRDHASSRRIIATINGK